MALAIGSMFSGYGGLDRAVEETFGGHPRWFCEYEDAPSKILAARYPYTPNHRDVTLIDWAKVDPVDIITAGYPCQPFSHAGGRKGQADERHLWPYVVDAMDALRPLYGVFENVRGHLTLGFDDVLRDIDVLGYEAQWRVNKAADIGAPHGRARVFILARRK